MFLTAPGGAAASRAARARSAVLSAAAIARALRSQQATFDGLHCENTDEPCTLSVTRRRIKVRVVRARARVARMNLGMGDSAIYSHDRDDQLLTLYQHGRMSLQLRARSRAERDSVAAVLTAFSRAPGEAFAPWRSEGPRLLDLSLRACRADGELGIDLNESNVVVRLTPDGAAARARMLRAGDKARADTLTPRGDVTIARRRSVHAVCAGHLARG